MCGKASRCSDLRSAGRLVLFSGYYLYMDLSVACPPGGDPFSQAGLDNLFKPERRITIAEFFYPGKVCVPLLLRLSAFHYTFDFFRFHTGSPKGVALRRYTTQSALIVV